MGSRVVVASLHLCVVLVIIHNLNLNMQLKW